MADIKEIPPGTTVYHVATPDFPGKTTRETRVFNRYNGENDKKMVLVRYEKPHPKFGRTDVYCDPNLLWKTKEEAMERHIPEEIYRKIENIIES